MIVLCGVTALAYYRLQEVAGLPVARPSQRTDLSGASCSVAEAREAFDLVCRMPADELAGHGLAFAVGTDTGPYVGTRVSRRGRDLCFSGPLHVLVGDHTHRAHNSRVVRHIWSGQVPSGSLRHVEGNVYVVSPDLLLLQMTRVLGCSHTSQRSRGMTLRGLHRLTWLADELCSDMALLPSGLVLRDGEREQRFVRRPRVTTAAELRGYYARFGTAEGTRAVPGLADMRKVLAWVREGAEAPNEISEAVMLGLPTWAGGMGHDSIELQVSFELDRENAALTGTRSCRVDLFVRASNCALESDGRFDHVRTPDGVVRDQTRDMVLRSLGMHLEHVTWSNFRSFDFVLQLNRRLCALRGSRRRKVSERTLARWREVHADLLDVNLVR